MISDIKPENILITFDGHIKLGDFGASLNDMCFGEKVDCWIGTPEYMSPEIWDRWYGREADWWAYGIVLYNIYFGEAPFVGSTLDSLSNRIKNRTLKFPSDTDPDFVNLIQSVNLFHHAITNLSHIVT